MRQLRRLRTHGWPKLRAKPLRPPCEHFDGRGAFLGLETEGEGAFPVSESHQLLSWFPRTQARVPWRLPCQCLEVGLLWGPDLIPFVAGTLGDLGYRSSSVTAPCLSLSLWVSVVPAAEWVCRGDDSLLCLWSWGLASRVFPCEGHQSGHGPWERDCARQPVCTVGAGFGVLGPWTGAGQPGSSGTQINEMMRVWG